MYVWVQGAVEGMKIIGTEESFGLDVELELWQVRRLKAEHLQQMYEVRGMPSAGTKRGGVGRHVTGGGRDAVLPWRHVNNEIGP